MAVELQRRGERVDLLVMLDSGVSGSLDPEKNFDEADILEDAGTQAFIRDYLRTTAEAAGQESLLRKLATITVHHKNLIEDYRTPVFDGDLLFFTATVDDQGFAAQWPPYVTGRIQQHAIACAHRDMASPENAAQIGALIAGALDQIQHS